MVCGSSGSTATKGSTSALAYSVPLAVTPSQPFANGVVPEAMDCDAVTATAGCGPPVMRGFSPAGSATDAAGAGAASC